MIGLFSNNTVNDRPVKRCHHPTQEQPWAWLKARIQSSPIFTTVQLSFQAVHHQTNNNQAQGFFTDWVTKKVKKLKETILEKTDNLERARSHPEALTKAVTEDQLNLRSLLSPLWSTRIIHIFRVDQCNSQRWTGLWGRAQPVGIWIHGCFSGRSEKTHWEWQTGTLKTDTAADTLRTSWRAWNHCGWTDSCVSFHKVSDRPIMTPDEDVYYNSVIISFQGYINIHQHHPSRFVRQ